MDDEIKLYKSFFVLTTVQNHKYEFLFKGRENKEVFNVKDKKIYISHKPIDGKFVELKVLWETSKLIKSEELNDNGEIAQNIQIVKEVNQAIIWLDLSSQLVFIFTRKNSLLKDVQELLQEYLDLETYNVKFTNQFFMKILKSNIVYYVQSSSFQSINGNTSSFTVSGGKIESSELFGDFMNQDHEITELTLVLRNSSKVKIYRNSKILIYNMISIYDVIDTIFDIKWLLMEGSDSLE